MTAEPLILRASIRVDAPFQAEDLSKFIAAIPAKAKVKVATFTEGQRDPVDKAYVFSAEWSDQ